MAKVNDIDIYKLEKYPTLQDYLLGSKQINGKTENFPLLAIVQLINSVNGIDAIQFRYSDGSDPDIDFTTKGTFFTDTNTTEVGTFSELIFNKSALSSTDLSTLFSFIGGRTNILMRLVNPNNPNTFFTYKIIGFENHTSYFVFDIDTSDELSLGSFENGVVYGVYFDVKQNVSLYTLTGGYTGTAQDLKNEIDNLIPLRSKFTLVQKSTDNINNDIEINDYARGFGPGAGVDLEYYQFAQYLNLTADDNVHNYLNYKAITVILPNS